jgi:hypothetical protein
MDKAHNYLTDQTSANAPDGKRLLVIQAIQSHLWKKLEDKHNFEDYGISAYLSEVRWLAKRMAKIQYLGTSILIMLSKLWDSGCKSPFDDSSKIKIYREDVRETFTARVETYEQALLCLNGDRIDSWPSVRFLLRQQQRKSAG